VADVLKAILIDTSARMGDDVPPLAVMLSLGELHDDLPELRRDELERDADFMTRLGRRRVMGMAIGDIGFPADDFWRAARVAVNGEPAAIVPPYASS
jgi:hypothetical protein